MKTYHIHLFFEVGGRPVEATIQARNLPDALRTWAKTEGIRVDSSTVERGKGQRSLRWGGYYIRPDYVSASAASTPVHGVVF